MTFTAPEHQEDLSGRPCVISRVAEGSLSGGAEHLRWLPFFEGGSPAIFLDDAERGTLI